jgi:hypothetical protein
VTDDGERSRSALIAATVMLMVVIVVVGYVSTGLFSLVGCGIETGTGYCARLYGGFHSDELYLILAPAVLAGWAGILSVQRRSARPLLKAGVALITVAALLPPLLLAVWT